MFLSHLIENSIHAFGNSHWSFSKSAKLGTTVTHIGLHESCRKVVRNVAFLKPTETSDLPRVDRESNEVRFLFMDLSDQIVPRHFRHTVGGCE